MPYQRPRDSGKTRARIAAAANATATSLLGSPS
jgi:hypothetical protein